MTSCKIPVVKSRPPVNDKARLAADGGAGFFVLPCFAKGTHMRKKDEVYGIDELAALISCSRQTVYRVIKQDLCGVDRPKKHGGAYIIGGERVEEFRELILRRQSRAPWAKTKEGTND